MTWSTRQLADLAGTTVKAVRHYHTVGLLEEPDRAANGYKQYGVRHLVRVLRIKRLADLGLPLAQIADLGDADERPEDALRVPLRAEYWRMSPPCCSVPSWSPLCCSLWPGVFVHAVNNALASTVPLLFT